ncbi:nuclear transport factor 2 family protein [uncultured Enterovirga sp.]|uniref:nuclear transport factor 2 family protein n=1 Tax=uncultured Enterovirga sp. TaxID=2026352 RepID=UPI0035CAE5A8
MTTTRRTIPVLLAAAAVSAATGLRAASPADDAVAQRVEAFRAAQVAADPKALDALCAPELTYSHSDGRVEDKAAFITNATAGRSRFTKLEYRNPSIRIVDYAAIVRFNWVGQQVATDGRTTDTNLHVLMVWQKRGSDWLLLARATTKL